jgi:cell division cycle 14
MYDMKEYDHYDSPSNGELHVVVPDRFVAFRGPTAITQDRHYQDTNNVRTFGPHYYLEIFQDLHVSTVIRLNEHEYDAGVFREAGMDHHDINFNERNPPTQEIVSSFLRIVDSAPGVIAMHCKAGLGRTGTLIAVYLMLAKGFRAREAMGWLRVVRPGSIIGDQQRYLCEVEARLCGAGMLKAIQDSDDREESAKEESDFGFESKLESSSVLARRKKSV